MHSAHNSWLWNTFILCIFCLLLFCMYAHMCMKSLNWECDFMINIHLQTAEKRQCYNWLDNYIYMLDSVYACIDSLNATSQRILFIFDWLRIFKLKHCSKSKIERERESKKNMYKIREHTIKTHLAYFSM